MESEIRERDRGRERHTHTHTKTPSLPTLIYNVIGCWATDVIPIKASEALRRYKDMFREQAGVCLCACQEKA